MPSPTPIPWPVWGPSKSRWFAPSGLANRWITTTCGQRHAIIGLGGERAEGEPESAPITVLDFNQRALRRYMAQRERGEPEQDGNGVDEVNVEVVEGPTELGTALFAERIVSGLPYLRVTTRKSYEYESVLLDEERIIGLKVR